MGDEIDQRVRVLENAQRMLMDQSAEAAVTLSRLDDRLQKAVTGGLREVLTDDELMDAVLERLRARLVRGAAESTGRWLWGSIKGALSKGLVIGVIVLLAWQFAGLASAKAMLAWLARD